MVLKYFILPEKHGKANLFLGAKAPLEIASVSKSVSKVS